MEASDSVPRHFNYHFGISRFAENRLSTRPVRRNTPESVRNNSGEKRIRSRRRVSDYHVTTSIKATILDICTRQKNFSRNLLRIFPLQSTSPTNVLRFSPGAACSSTVSWLSRVSWREAVSLERSGYQFDSDAVRGGEARTCGREDERAM